MLHIHVPTYGHESTLPFKYLLQYVARCWKLNIEYEYAY